jgi:hypothetical protein
VSVMTKDHSGNGRARLTPEQARQVAAAISPKARQARETVRQGAQGAMEWSRPRVIAVREWAAPQLQHAGELVRDELGPRASGLLFTAAHKVEVPRQSRRWPKLVAGMATLAAAASVAALAMRRRPGTLLHVAPEPAGGAGNGEEGQPSGGGQPSGDGQAAPGEAGPDTAS